MSYQYLEITRGTDTGRLFKLADGANTIGRSADNSIRLDKSDRVVSSHQAIIYKYPGMITIQDMSSTNGTYVNNVRIEQQELSVGDEIGFGEKGPRLKLIFSDEEISQPVAQRAEKSLLKTSDTDNTGLEISSIQDNDSLFPSKPCTPLLNNGGLGSLTMNIEHKLINNQINADDMCKLMNKTDRVEKIMQQGNLSRTQTHFLQTAFRSHHKSKNKFLAIIALITVVFLLTTGFFSVRMFQYKNTLNEAQKLKRQLEGYEQKISEAQSSGAEQDEITGLVNEFEKTRSEFNSIRMALRQEDFNSVYKDTVELFLNDILSRFGETDYHIPPQMLERVKFHISEFTGPLRRTTQNFFRRKESYFPMIHRVFTENNLPLELSYISMLESGFNIHAVSHAGAVGLWQFMPHTGRRYGLRVDDHIDERTDPQKATLAAAAYLTDLISIFGGRSSIMLAMAAYNAGEARIIGALRRIDNPMQNRCFWYIYRMQLLAEETNEYIPKILALMILDENREYYGF